MFTLKWLQKHFNDTIGTLDQDMDILQVSTDSRDVGKNTLFIPLVGERFDGHDYVEDVFKAGAKIVFYQKNKSLPTEMPEGILYILVDDTLKALQQLAHHYKNLINPTVIGITGSNGKTTTKDIVSEVLKTTYKTHQTAGNYNNHIGLPLTILSMDPNTEMLVLEMGMNHFDEISLLSKIAEPHYAIITNIGESHIEHLGSRAGIARAKTEITEGIQPNGMLIYDGDEPLIEQALNQRNFDRDQQIHCGFAKENEYKVEVLDIIQKYTMFTINEKTNYKIPLLGAHHAKNASYAIALANKLGIPTERIQSGFEHINVTGMRFEWLEGKKGVQIINDAYNASPTSMRAAIEVVKQMQGFNKKILVLGDIFELGSHQEALHKQVADSITDDISVLCTYGEMVKVIADEIRNQINIDVHHFTNVNELIHYLQPLLAKENLILFKASRGMHFETIIEHILK